MKKYWAKKVLKKMSRGGSAMDSAIKREFDEDAKLAGGGMRETKSYEDEITKPVKLAGGGFPMEDVLKKENYPKKAHGGDVKKYRGELKSEIKGMGPEGKAYLRDELERKKYEGKLKDKYKGELGKELYGMGKKGKEYLKSLVVKKAKEAKKRNPKARKAGHSLGEIIESPRLKAKFRKSEGVPKRDIAYAKGGAALGQEIEYQTEPKIKPKFKDGGDWIQGAVKKPGALRAVAAREGLIKGDQKLSGSDLSKLGAQAKKSGNSLLAKRVSLAKTFAKMRKKK